MADRELRKKQITTKRHTQILNAATEIFVRKGFTDATIPEIAKLSGLAAGTIYIYYPNKRELFIAVIEGLIVIPVQTIFKKDTKNDLTHTIQDVVDDRLGMLQSEAFPRLMSLIGDIQRDAELRSIFTEKLMRPFLGYVENIYCERIKAGELRQMDPELVVRMIGGMMLGINLLKSIEGENSSLNRLSKEKIAREMINFILFGLSNNKSEFKQEKK
jgi:AcrR family transcriptional regulator